MYYDPKRRYYKQLEQNRIWEQHSLYSRQRFPTLLPIPIILPCVWSWITQELEKKLLENEEIVEDKENLPLKLDTDGPEGCTSEVLEELS